CEARGCVGGRDATSIEQEPRAVFEPHLALFDPALQEPFVDEGPVVDALVQRIADFQRPGTLQQLVAHRRQDAFVDDDVAGARAPLAGGAERRPEGALPGEIQVGVGQDHERVFAAEPRLGSCRLRPQTSPILRPTAVEPVNEILSSRPASTISIKNSPAALAPPPWTTFKTPSGSPARDHRSANSAAVPGASSEGFQTAALPHRIAGTSFQEGTAMGKLPA